MNLFYNLSHWQLRQLLHCFNSRIIKISCQIANILPVIYCFSPRKGQFPLVWIVPYLPFLIKYQQSLNLDLLFYLASNIYYRTI